MDSYISKPSVNPNISEPSIDPCILSVDPYILGGPWIAIFGPVHSFLYFDWSVDPLFPEKCLVQTKSRFESGFSLDKSRFYFSKLSRLNPDFFLDQIQIWTQSGQFFKIKIKFVQIESRFKSGFCLDQTVSRKKSGQENQIIWTRF